MFHGAKKEKSCSYSKKNGYLNSSLALDAEKETVLVEITRDDGGHAVAQCSSCGIKEEFPVKPAQGEVDVYCMLTDRVYSTIKRTPITKN